MNIGLEKAKSKAFVGVLFFFMGFMVVAANIARGVQYIDKVEAGSDILGTNYKASFDSLVYGHVIFFVALVIACVCIYGYAMDKNLIGFTGPVIVSVLIIIGGCIVMFWTMVFGDLGESLTYPKGAVDLPFYMWPLMTFISFIFLLAFGFSGSLPEESGC